jgi:hypothetical protein
MSDAIRDANHVPVALGADSATGLITLPLLVDPNTGKLVVVSTDGGAAGPGSSTDNAVARWDGTTGLLLQNSLVIISDLGVVDAVGYKAGGTAAVADGTYTVGLKLTGGGVNGTITTKGGIITAIQQAT